MNRVGGGCARVGRHPSLDVTGCVREALKKQEIVWLFTEGGKCKKKDKKEEKKKKGTKMKRKCKGKENKKNIPRQAWVL